MTQSNKPKLGWGSVTERILIILKDLGPMHAIDLSDHIEASRSDIRKACARMILTGKRGTSAGIRRVHIKRWEMDADGHRPYPRPVYAIGHGRNASKPKPKPRSEIARSRVNKLQMRQTHNFVFNLGLS